MSEHACTECHTMIHVVDEWESMADDEVITCPKCNTAFTLNYDEPYDEETGEANGYFYLDKIEWGK